MSAKKGSTEYTEQLAEASALVVNPDLEAATGDQPQEHQNYSELSEEDKKKRREWLVRRAKKQADRGMEHLTKKHRGVLVVRKMATINNRFVARSFQRFFSSTEFALSLAARDESRLVFPGGKMATALSQLESLITEFNESARQELRGISEVYESSKQDNDDFIIPTYNEAALEIEVSILTPQGNGLYKTLKSYDEIIEKLTVLYWNGIYPADRIQDAEHNAKDGMRKIYMASRRIILGLNNKFQEMVDKGAEVKEPVTS